MGKLVIIRPNADEGGEPPTETYAGREPSIARLQKLVGGYVEHLAVNYQGAPRSAYVDEEARLSILPGPRTLAGGTIVDTPARPVPRNSIASALAGREILGTMVIDLGARS